MAAKKKSKPAEPARSDPKENNWEIPDEMNKNIQFVPEIIVNKVDFYNETILNTLQEAWEKVEEELRKNNPVRHWAVADDHCTFVFRDGRKIRVEY